MIIWLFSWWRQKGYQWLTRGSNSMGAPWQHREFAKGGGRCAKECGSGTQGSLMWSIVSTPVLFLVMKHNWMIPGVRDVAMLKKGGKCKGYIVGEGDAETEAISIEVSKVSTIWEVAKGVLPEKKIYKWDYIKITNVIMTNVTVKS